MFGTEASLDKPQQAGFAKIMSKTKKTSKKKQVSSNQKQKLPYELKKISKSLTFTMSSPLKSAVQPDKQP